MQRHIGEVAVNLVGACEHHGHAGTAAAQRFEQREGAACVDVEVGARIAQARRHRHLCSEMEYRRDIADRAFNGVPVADVGLHMTDALAVDGGQPGEIGLNAGPRQRVEHDHLMAFACKAMRHVGADEPGATRHQNAGADVPVASCGSCNEAPLFQLAPGLKDEAVLARIPALPGRQCLPHAP